MIRTLNAFNIYIHTHISMHIYTFYLVLVTPPEQDIHLKKNQMYYLIDTVHHLWTYLFDLGVS